MPFLLGLDIGTTHLKAALYDLEGREFGVAVANTPTISEKEGWAEYDPEDLWRTMAALIRQVAAKAVGDQIVGIATTGMAEAGLLLDKRGVPLHRIISWYDNRTESQFRWWKEHFNEQEIFTITGLEIDKISSLNKVMWLQSNHPDLFVRATRWLCITDYITYRLSGEMVTDYSIAARTMAFDIQKKNWSDDLLAAAGISRSLWPTPVPSGTIIGGVTEEAVKATGLRRGLPVVTGGHDHVCAALAVGAIDQTTILDSWGTAEVILITLSSCEVKDRLRRSGFQIGVHVVPDRYYLIGVLPFSGGIVEWLRKAFPGLKSYEKIFQAAEKSPPGARKLVFLPHLLGAKSPIPDPDSTAALVGLRSYHTHTDIIRAILEGVCYELKAALHAAEAFLKQRADTICAVGGGVRSVLWRQIKADVTGKRLIVPDFDEAAAKGAALLIGIATGVYPTAEAATKRTYRMHCLVEPVQDQHAIYEQIYQNVYRIMYHRLNQINEELQKIP